MLETKHNPFSGDASVVISGVEDFNEFSNALAIGMTAAVQQQNQGELFKYLTLMASAQPKPGLNPQVMQPLVALRAAANALQMAVLHYRAILATRPNAVIYADSGTVAAATNADITVNLTIANGVYRYMGLIADPQTIRDFGGRTLTIGGQLVATLGTSGVNDAGTLAVFAHDAFPDGRPAPWTGQVFVQNQPVQIGVRNVTGAPANARFAVLVRIQPQGQQVCDPTANAIMGQRFPQSSALL